MEEREKRSFKQRATEREAEGCWEWHGRKERCDCPAIRADWRQAHFVSLIHRKMLTRLALMKRHVKEQVELEGVLVLTVSTWSR